MRTIPLVVGLAAFAACAVAPQHRVDVDGTIEYVTIEGGFWAIRGDDGVTYDPRVFPPDFRKEGLRVHAVLIRRDNMASVHGVGPVVDILDLEVLPCGPVPCPPPPAPVQLTVVDGSGAAVSAAELSSVTGPPGLGSATPSCTTGPDPIAGAPRTLCVVIGTAAGTYEADVGAPGFQTVHVRVDVPSRAMLAGECCPVGYVPQRLSVMLAPAP